MFAREGRMMLAVDPDWLRPDWQWPGIGALMTTRAGGVGCGPYASMNLRDGIGDDPAHVAHNRSRLAAAIGVTPVYLEQVHGSRVVRLTAADGLPGAAVHVADASVTCTPGIACTAQVADCLPVLFAAPGARAVGAAHAGWRGLASGVLEAAVQAVCETAACAPKELLVWLGASIGPRRFEVGRDVLAAFDTGHPPHYGPHLGETARFVARAPDKWLANLPLLAADRLRASGVRLITGGTWCTVEHPSRFFSFRRDRVTGRMVAAVWIEPGQ